MSSMRTPRCSYMENVSNAYTTSCKDYLLSLQQAEPKLRDVHTIMLHPAWQLETEKFNPWMRHLYWFCMDRIQQLMHTQSNPFYTLRISCYRRNMMTAGWWVIEYDVIHIRLLMFSISYVNFDSRHLRATNITRNPSIHPWLYSPLLGLGRFSVS
jgi:hypothetical protein